MGARNSIDFETDPRSLADYVATMTTKKTA